MLPVDIQKRELVVENAEFFPFLISLIEQGHTASLRLKGFSMRPFLENERDTALLQRAADIVPGQPVLAEISKGHYVLHRVIKVEGENVTLLGDGNLSEEHCRKSDVKAQAVGFYRKGAASLDRTDGFKWRCYSFFWMRFRPVRRYLLAFYRRWVKVFGPL